MDEQSVVDDPDEIEAVLAALGGKYAARILAATDRPLSAQEISGRLEVPIATCYRRIDELEEAGLLVCEGRETSDRGRRTKVFRRTVDGAAVSLDGDRPGLALDGREEATDGYRER